MQKSNDSIAQKISGTVKNDNRFRRKLLLFAGIAICLYITIAYIKDRIAVIAILESIEHLGIWAPSGYILVYVLISGIIIPSIILKVSAGTLFGVLWGTVLVSIASTVSSSIKFFLARYLFRERIQRKVESSKNLKTIDTLIEKDGWKMLLILRNVPVVNSMLLNYICGITGMGFRDFAVASFIGRLPTTLMYVYFGYIIRYTYTVEFKAKEAGFFTLERIMLYIGLAATVFACWYLIRLSKKVLAKDAPSVVAP